MGGQSSLTKNGETSRRKGKKKSQNFQNRKEED